MSIFIFLVFHAKNLVFPLCFPLQFDYSLNGDTWHDMV